jgi:hypothetical protein
VAGIPNIEVNKFARDHFLLIPSLRPAADAIECVHLIVPKVSHFQRCHVLDACKEYLRFS